MFIKLFMCILLDQLGCYKHGQNPRQKETKLIKIKQKKVISAYA